MKYLGVLTPIALLGLVSCTPVKTSVDLGSEQSLLSHNRFSHFKQVSTSQNDHYFIVASNGIPDHPVMEGITNWQQQVVLPQDYTANNAWKIPLHPELAETPLLTKEHFHRGAVAVAVNGVPIFNAANNRGEFATEIGELDRWGGHAGKADDYHYHLIPEHLEQIVGENNPVAFALDGFPVFGKTDAELDEYLGRFTENGSYQYHAVDHAPYFIAGLRGKVSTDSIENAPEDQIIPQPFTRPIRTADYGPLPGAEITHFTKHQASSYSLEYQLNGHSHHINYSWDNDGLHQFEYVDAEGNITTEIYEKLNQLKQEHSEEPPKKVRPATHIQQADTGRKYCGDGMCDNTETTQQCPADC
ncbi:MAG: YHYH protein [Paraglaciecola sp.]|uniref:YHYH protein n=2 Tax=Paraglaciecola sp. TaxID=1920173 RepID=UPI00326396EB